MFKTPSTTHGPIYPVPPKSLVPNVEPGNDRKSLQGNMALSARTANVTRNLERLSHVTTHQLSHTGHGSAFPLALDNMDEQRARLHHGLEQNTALVGCCRLRHSANQNCWVFITCNNAVF